jgi:large conductance mechanosensitive channel
MSFYSEFKAFIAKGNVLQLAVAVVIGVAFTAIVTALVEGLIMPLVGLVLPSGSWQTWAPGGFAIGRVIAAIINFVIVALVVFVAVVKGAGRFLDKPAPTPTTRPCPECLEPVALAARRCKACGQPVAA